MESNTEAPVGQQSTTENRDSKSQAQSESQSESQQETNSGHLKLEDCVLFSDQEELIDLRNHAYDLVEGLKEIDPSFKNDLETKYLKKESGDVLRTDFIDEILKKRTLQIGLIGGTGVGKSTIGNILVKQPVFPSGGGVANTSVPTKVFFEKVDHRYYRIDKHKNKESFRDVIKKSITPEMDTSKEKELELSLSEGRYGDFKKRVEEIYKDDKENLCKWRGIAEALLQDSPQSLPIGERRLEFGKKIQLDNKTTIAEQIDGLVGVGDSRPWEFWWIESVSVILPSEKDWHIEIIDIPGTGSANTEQTGVAEQSVKKVDGFLLLYNSQRVDQSVTSSFLASILGDLVSRLNSETKAISNADVVPNLLRGRIVRLFTKFHELACPTVPDKVLDAIIKSENTSVMLNGKSQPLSLQEMGCVFVSGKPLEEVWENNKDFKVAKETAEREATDFLNSLQEQDEKKDKKNYVKKLREHLEKLPDEQRNYKVPLQSWLDNAGFDQLWKLVYKEFPESVKKALVGDVKRELKDLGEQLKKFFERRADRETADYLTRCENIEKKIVQFQEKVDFKSDKGKEIWSEGARQLLKKTQKELQRRKSLFEHTSAEARAAQKNIYESSSNSVKSNLEKELKVVCEKFLKEFKEVFPKTEVYKLHGVDYRERLEKFYLNFKEREIQNYLEDNFPDKEFGIFENPDFSVFERAMLRKAWVVYRLIANRLTLAASREFVALQSDFSVASNKNPVFLEGDEEKEFKRLEESTKVFRSNVQTALEEA